MTEMALVSVHKFKVVAEHADQVFLQTHHQWVHPVVENHIRPFPAHLRACPCGNVLHMHRCADHGAWDPQSLGAVTFHLRAEHQFRSCFSHGRLDSEVVVTDQRLQAHGFGSRPDRSGHLAAVGPEADNLEAQFLPADPGRCQCMGAVSEDEHPLPREVGGIHRLGIPGQAGSLMSLAAVWGIHAQQPVHFREEIVGGTDPDRNGAGEGNAEVALQPAAGRFSDLGIQADVQIGLWQTLHIADPGSQGSDDSHINSMQGEQSLHFEDVIAAAEPEQ